MKIKNFRFISAVIFSLSVIYLSGFPITAQTRKVSNFDTDWRFTKGAADNAEKADFNDNSWQKLSIPHDWSIAGPFDEKAPTTRSGAFLPSGVAWYRKHFTVSPKDKNRLVSLELDGVMGISDVWINGTHLGQRPNSYISVAYDLTKYINLGADNVIAVRADTTLQPASRWYTGAGIYRHARLVVKDAVNIPTWGTFVSTPQVSASSATVKVASEVANQTNQPKTVSLKAIVIDPNGKTVASGESAAQTVAPNQTIKLEKEIVVKNPQLWHVEKGVMYQAVAQIQENGKTIDDEAVPFGIREFHFDANTGFWMNGKNFKILGACLHHDGSAFGAAVPLGVWERRFKELRKLGVNAIRTAHNPPAPEFLDLADRMGFLVMDELFDQWTVAKNPYDYHLYFNEWSKRDVTDTVRRDRNHPSVILYSAGNEIHDTPKPEIAIPILKGLVETFHANDTTRPVTQGLFRPNVSKDYDNGLADLLDVIGQNYREKEILAAHKQKPTRKIVGTENTHDLNQWVAMRDNPEYSGQFIWSGIDYLGESPGYPIIAGNFGLLYRSATPRPVGYQRQSWWSEKPMVYITRRVAPTEKAPTDPGYDATLERRPQVLFGDWTPQNTAKHEETVEIYSNCEEVELFLNGVSLGVKSLPKDDSARVWKVGYEAGTIKAIGKTGGKTVAEYEMKTAGTPAKIELSVDKPQLKNDWNDVAFVTVTVRDANGVIVPSAENLIRFETKGAGLLAAVDSDDNRSHESFQGTTRRAWQGTCFAILKANANKGKITLTAMADGLPSQSITIQATK